MMQTFNTTILNGDMEPYALRYEEILHALVRDYEITPSFKTLYYCLYHHVVTKEQLHHSGLTGGSSPKSCYRLLCRMAQKGDLLSHRIQIGSMPSTVFSLSPAGLQRCVREAASQALLPEETLIRLSARSQNWRMKPNLAHFLSIRDLNACLLGNPLVSSDYHFDAEAGIDHSGRLMQPGDGCRDAAIRSDAVAVLPVPGGGHQLYLEQDTGTQRSGIIAKKTSSYLSTVLGAREDDSSHSLLFSLLPPATSPPAERRAASPSVLHYAAPLPCICHILGLDMEAPCSLSTLEKEIRERCMAEAAAPTASFTKNLWEILQEAQAEHPAYSVAQFLSLFRSRSSIRSERRKAEADRARRRSFLSRKRLITASISNLPGIRDAFLRGFSVFFAMNETLGATLQPLLPGAFQGAFFVHPLFLLCASRAKEYELSYRPSSGRASGDGYLLRNEYASPDGLVVLVENISDDLGGPVRVRQYASSLRWSGRAGILLCLHDGSHPGGLGSLVKDTPYLRLLDEGVPLIIVLCSYRDFSLRTGYQEFSPAGIPVPFTGFPRLPEAT